MERLIEKVENLKKILDENKKIKEIRELNKEIFNDKELLGLIVKYQSSQDIKIKEKILESKLFQKYKESELDINIIVLEINQKLKELGKHGSCNL